MTSEEIARHLSKFREEQDRVALAEKARIEEENRRFAESCARCEGTLREVVEPMLDGLSAILEQHGHSSMINRTQATEHVTERTKFRSLEYAVSITVQAAKGTLILRVAASPSAHAVYSSIGIPHGGYSSVVTVDSGPLEQAGDIANRGIADFITSAFPLRSLGKGDLSGLGQAIP